MADSSTTVIINNFNYEMFLKEAITSVLEQTLPPRQCIVVDDGSTDGSRDLIRQFLPQVIAVFKTNGGQTSAYQAGLKLAEAPYILFLDADDFLLPHCLEVIEQHLESSPTKIHFPLRCVDASGHPLGWNIPHTCPKTDVHQLVEKFGAYSSPPSSGNVYRKDFLSDIFPCTHPDLLSTGDTYPLTLAPYAGRVQPLFEPLGCHRIHQSNRIPSPHEGTGHNTSADPRWLHAVVRRDRAAFSCARKFAESAGSTIQPPEFPTAPFILRYDLAHRKLQPGSLPQPVSLVRQSLAGLMAALTYPGYGWTERGFLFAWIAFLALTPGPLLRWLRSRGILIQPNGQPAYRPAAGS